MPEIELVGLPGDNLLGFMAALGTLRVLTRDLPTLQMKWVSGASVYPILTSAELPDPESIILRLGPLLCGAQTANRAWEIGDDLTMPCLEFAGHLRDETEPEAQAFLAAFGTDASNAAKKKDQIADTAFRTMSGAGHQHFLGFMRQIAAETTPAHLERALFYAWEYRDGKPSMRWDPNDYRPHALRADDPSGDPIRTIRGANRLAIEALPLFPVVALSAGRSATLSFSLREGVAETSWPIWSAPLCLETAKSLLGLQELQADVPDRAALLRRGITQAFRAQRFTDGKFRNFSMARPLI